MQTEGTLYFSTRRVREGKRNDSQRRAASTSARGAGSSCMLAWLRSSEGMFLRELFVATKGRGLVVVRGEPPW